MTITRRKVLTHRQLFLLKHVGPVRNMYTNSGQLCGLLPEIAAYGEIAAVAILYSRF